MKDKTDYESARDVVAKKFAEPGPLDGIFDVRCPSEFIEAADWSRRFCYTEDKVIGELLDAVNIYIAFPGNMLFKELINARRKFLEEKKKWEK